MSMFQPAVFHFHHCDSANPTPRRCSNLPLVPCRLGSILLAFGPFVTLTVCSPVIAGN
ncbi:hypothetical protein BO99DRAFT_149720 [Aspergillus violaceofuscus CBS 115571]|uniref:Uncharacterized protein n=1 Tax=Aspergillus violaceofuscus (strain CBS 115571) TaxID=1450538 RepID=A0A2V5IGT4_ASPV1|nr:hypothetical protein BO99DRAFT_149720 [Aspergillus violaceofuscus CBS 115571]